MVMNAETEKIVVYTSSLDESDLDEFKQLNNFDSKLNDRLFEFVDASLNLCGESETFAKQGKADETSRDVTQIVCLNNY